MTYSVVLRGRKFFVTAGSKIRAVRKAADQYMATRYYTKDARRDIVRHNLIEEGMANVRLEK